MKILNLYAGIGGNRKLWDYKITAVEINPNIAEVYKKYFPNDEVIVGDAHQYLLDHFQEFDFIWSSPPCQSHGQYRYNVGVRAKGYKAVYPDLKLYEEIFLLKYYFKGLYVVENVIPYYEPLIEPTLNLQRHLIWCNFDIPVKSFPAKGIRSKNKISDYDYLGFDVKNSKIENKRQVLRNCVDPEIGKYILDCSKE
jgi:DNA (cytosine-5)-methyltransferase 1